MLVCFFVDKQNINKDLLVKAKLFFTSTKSFFSIWKNHPR